MATLSAKQERITPEKAELYLAANIHNRRLRANTVRRLAGAIKRGEWMNNGETIKFNGDGKLIDGQHRLAAIVKADQSVDALVVRGLTVAAQETIDAGIRRNPSDALQLRGFTDGTTASAACVAAHVQERYGRIVYRPEATPTHQQVIEIAEGDRAQIERVSALALQFRKDHPEFGLSASMTSQLVYGFTLKTSFETATKFLKAVVDNEEGAPSVLRRSLIEDRVNRGRMSRNVRLAFTVKAFNAWVNNYPLKRLRWKRQGPNREQFPEIVSA